MRVVLLGKGGSGKSTLAGLLCAELAGRGRRVLAFDADSVPGLGQVLGMDPTDDWFLAGRAVREAGGWTLTGGLAATVEECARVGPAGIRFLQMGNADAGMKDFPFTAERSPGRRSGMVAFNTVVRSYDDEGGFVVVDLHGGTLQVASGMVGTRGVAMVVVEPFAKSVLTARRFAGMGEWPAGVQFVAVANKVTGSEDQRYLDDELSRLGIEVWGSVPADRAVSTAEREGRALVSLGGDGPARRAVAALADRLEQAALEPATSTAAAP